MRKGLMIAAGIELAGIALIGAGIVLEVIYKADVFLVVITSGSVLVAMGGVIWGKLFKGGKE